MSVGAGVSVGVAVNVNTSRSTNEFTDRDLDMQIALDVAEATNNFDPRQIERLKRLAKNRLPGPTNPSPQLTEAIDV